MPEEAIAELRPELSPAAEEAIDMWNAMGGWFPERLPVLLEALGCYHLDGLIERLMTIRDCNG